MNPDPVQASAAHYTNKQNQNENIHSISKFKTVRKAQVTKQKNKQIKGQSKISRFLIHTKLSGVVGGVKAQTKTKTKNIHTIKPGSKQAHHQSDAQDIHTKPYCTPALLWGGRPPLGPFALPALPPHLCLPSPGEGSAPECF